MELRPFVRLLLALVVAAAVTVVAYAAPGKDKRPNLTLTASPIVAFAPARVLLTAEVKGGPDDDAQFYCPAVEWDWGDGTVSESSNDCPPFEAGKTTIQRRYTTQHLYKEGGEFRVKITLKRNEKIVTSASSTLEIRAGLGGDDRDR